MELTVVIARYNEDISWVDQLNCNYIIYNKGGNLDREHIKLPNVGRESNTYLNFIISNYHTIQSPIAFVQGDPFYHCPKVINLINTYSQGVIFLNRRQGPFINNGDGTPSHTGLPVTEWAEKLGVKQQNNKYGFANGAQYIIPPEAITSKPLSWWEHLLELHDTPAKPFRKEPNQSPWIFERLWYYIFTKNINL